jgi:hypothetical protein
MWISGKMLNNDCLSMVLVYTHGEGGRVQGVPLIVGAYIDREYVKMTTQIPLY